MTIVSPNFQHIHNKLLAGRFYLTSPHMEYFDMRETVVIGFIYSVYRRKGLSSIHGFDISAIPFRIRIVKLNLGSHRMAQ